MEVEEKERKKEYLRAYKRHVRRINRIESELEEIREMKASPAIINDGMPHTGNQSDLSDYVSKIDDLEHELVRERNQRTLAYKDIADRIKQLRSENEKDVLFYRYVKGLEWWEIASKMGYTERWILKLHGNALAHLNLPKEFIEVQ